MFIQEVSYSAAFMAGLLSFLSPCVLPLIPAYFTFITGYSLEELTEGGPKGMRFKVMLSTINFILGFSLVFILLGATASLMGRALLEYQHIIRIAGGIIIIIFGLHISGVFRLKFLEFEKRVHMASKPAHILGTFVVGMAFGAGWSPCVGPFLGSILAIAASEQMVGKGISLLAIYSAGLAIPFLIISIFIHLILSVVRRGTRVMKYINAVAGVLLIVVGVLLVIDKLTFLS
jgi:cytochrome c-type biogenesis protein